MASPAGADLSAIADAGRWAHLVGGISKEWNNDPRGLWSSFAMIIFSEIGDKTFLIAAILAMRQSRLIVFLGAFSSLAVMSVLSALLGVMFPSLLPKSLTTLMASALFFVFGAKMMVEGRNMDGSEMDEEWQEAQAEIEGEEAHEMRDVEEGLVEESAEASQHTQPLPGAPIRPLPNGNGHAHRRSSIATKAATSSSAAGLKEGMRNLCGLCFTPVFAQSFVLTFLGEWGDRSQIATIALAAAHNVVLVCIGTIVGHSLCTGLAVLGGGALASRISIKHVTLVGATLFLLFGFIYLYESFSEWFYVSASSAISDAAGVAKLAGGGIVAAAGGAAADLAGGMPNAAQHAQLDAIQAKAAAEINAQAQHHGFEAVVARFFR